MIVKIEFKEHNRNYSIGIMPFLKMLGYDEDEKHIKKVIKEYLSKHA